jgi:hypothetical protein
MERWKAATTRAPTAARAGYEAVSLLPDLRLNSRNAVDIRSSRGIRVKTRARSHWHRPVQRAGLPLALFAVVLQAVISFSHHHFDLYAVRSFRGGITASSVSPRGDRRDAPIVPEHGPCLVCVAIHAAPPPVVDALPNLLPVYDNGALLSRPAFALLSAPPRVAAFDSRAPPLA